MPRGNTLHYYLGGQRRTTPDQSLRSAFPFRCARPRHCRVAGANGAVSMAADARALSCEDHLATATAE